MLLHGRSEETLSHVTMLVTLCHEIRRNTITCHNASYPMSCTFHEKYGL
jgi:hypothetical protein